MELAAQRSAWADALQAQALLAVAPSALGGVVVRAAAGPVRDHWLAGLAAALPAGTPSCRMPPGVGVEELLGGLDLAATLAGHAPVMQRGLLARAAGGLLLIPMAERLARGPAALVAAALDRGSAGDGRGSQPAPASGPCGFAVVALDEGLPDDPALPSVLAERLALSVDLRGIGMEAAGLAPARVDRNTAAPPARETARRAGDPAGGNAAASAAARAAALAEARARVPGIVIDAAWIEALCAAALRLGIASLHRATQSAQVARLASALRCGASVESDDAAWAARLVLAPRTTRLPPAETDAAPAEPPTPPASAPATPPEPPLQDAEAAADAAADALGAGPSAPPPSPASTDAGVPQRPPEPPPSAAERREQAAEERLVDAARAALPPGLLAQLQAIQGASVPAAARGRVGVPVASGQHGRPRGVRPGLPSGRARLDLLATLRAAAPWQRLREPAPGAAGGRLQIRKSDLHVRRREAPRPTTTLFVVDASGSAAAERLAEAKGAVELMLAESYVRRDQVAVIAFRGRRAELLLPPTRSLVRAKRCLAGLPGGGGTPMASALDAAAGLLDGIVRSGASPSLVLLTDGCANVARDGTGGRARARADALLAARSIAALPVARLLIDTAAEPRADARALAAALDARYAPLPRADARALSNAVRHAVRPAVPQGDAPRACGGPAALPGAGRRG